MPLEHTPRRAELLFAYGTLMRGYPLHAVIAGRAAYVESGSVRGALVDLGQYPGLLEGKGRVVGEVYRLETPELLPVVDREEGYNFQRCRMLVTLVGGRRMRAWAYRYRGPRERATLIAAGDYRRARPPLRARRPCIERRTV
ncbi:MAG: gamma-glutamylcyclotransferase family protein [Candidatus Rokuibacteriota bacterium]